MGTDFVNQLVENALLIDSLYQAGILIHSTDDLRMLIHHNFVLAGQSVQLVIDALILPGDPQQDQILEVIILYFVFKVFSNSSSVILKLNFLAMTSSQKAIHAFL